MGYTIIIGERMEKEESEDPDIYGPWAKVAYDPNAPSDGTESDYLNERSFSYNEYADFAEEEDQSLFYSIVDNYVDYVYLTEELNTKIQSHVVQHEQNRSTVDWFKYWCDKMYKECDTPIIYNR